MKISSKKTSLLTRCCIAATSFGVVVAAAIAQDSDETAERVRIAAANMEDEAIAWHLAEEIEGKVKKKKDRKVYRVLFNEITESAIKRALQSPGQIDMNLVNAQQARRVLDRIVGYQGSQLLWIAFAGQNRIQKGHSGHTRQVAEHVVELQIHLLQRLVHVLDRM